MATLSLNTGTPGSRVRPAAAVGITLTIAVLGGLWLTPQFGVKAPLLFITLVGIILVLSRPQFGLYFLIFSIPLESVFILGEGVTWVRVIGTFVFGAWILHMLLGRKSWRDLLSSNILKPAILFSIFAFASLLWAEHSPSAVGIIPTIFQLLGLSLLVIGIVNTQERLEWVIRILIVSGIVASSITIHQFFVQGVDRAGRNVATQGINQTAVTLVVLIPLAFYLFRASKLPLWRLVGLSYIAVSSLAVIVTFSRASLIALPIVLALQVLAMGRDGRKGLFRIVFIGVIAVGMVYAIIPWQEVLDSTSTITGEFEETRATEPDRPVGRVGLWLGALDIFYDHPLLGTGIGNFGFQFEQRTRNIKTFFVGFLSPHSTFFGLLAELGLIGIFLWGWLHMAAFRNLRRGWRSTSRARHGLSLILVQAVIFSFVIYTLYSIESVTHIHKLFWVILGLTEAIRRIAIRQNQAASETAPQLSRQALL